MEKFVKGKKRTHDKLRVGDKILIDCGRYKYYGLVLEAPKGQTKYTIGTNPRKQIKLYNDKSCTEYYDLCKGILCFVTENKFEVVLE